MEEPWQNEARSWLIRQGAFHHSITFCVGWEKKNANVPKTFLSIEN